jgi:ketosteroid isomerase-like protein
VRRRSQAAAAYLLALLGGFAVTAPPSASGADPGRAADVRALIEQLRYIETLAGAADNARYLDLFTDDTVLLPPDRPAIAGKVAALAFYDEAFRGAGDVRVRYHDPVIEIDGALAVRRYAASGTVEHLDPPRIVEIRTKYLDVLKKQPDGSWRIAMHMWSTNEPPQ